VFGGTLNLAQSINLDSDGSVAVVRTVFVDFHKAFDSVNPN